MKRIKTINKSEYCGKNELLSLKNLRNKSSLVSLPKKTLGAKDLTEEAKHQIGNHFKAIFGVELLKTSRTTLLGWLNMKKVLEVIGNMHKQKAHSYCGFFRQCGNLLLYKTASHCYT